jgi:hypothetical protein
MQLPYIETYRLQAAHAWCTRATTHTRTHTHNIHHATVALPPFNNTAREGTPRDGGCDTLHYSYRAIHTARHYHM